MALIFEGCPDHPFLTPRTSGNLPLSIHFYGPTQEVPVRWVGNIIRGDLQGQVYLGKPIEEKIFDHAQLQVQVSEGGPS